MKPLSLLDQGSYSLEWVKDFYEQTGVWWGPNVDFEAYEGRADTVARRCGSGSKRILDLGAGPGGNAAALAKRGHQVVAVELSPRRAAFARELAKQPWAGSLEVVEGDFYQVRLAGCFEVVCCWEVFGLGSDADQRRLLRRIASEWLAPGGSVLMDVYNPTRPARAAGSQVRLAPLKGVPGSVEMFERTYFDPLHCRWIDEWVPTAAPQQALAQTIRCYTPPDLLLLLEGTGLQLTALEVEEQALDFASPAITTSGPLLEAWSYVVQLTMRN